MDFVVRVSKEERKVHVIFTSSDSFFFEWLQLGLIMFLWFQCARGITSCFAAVPSAHMRIVVLDDLSLEDSKKYFLKIIPDEEKSLFKSDCDCFDNVFKITGGRIVFIDQYVHEVILNEAPLQGWSTCIFLSSRVHSILFDRNKGRFLTDSHFSAKFFSGSSRIIEAGDTAIR
jgi:hypothetical protein